MADAPQPSIDTKETDKKMRERVDKLIAQGASESVGSITHLLVGFLGVDAGLRRVGHGVSCQ